MSTLVRLGLVEHKCDLKLEMLTGNCCLLAEYFTKSTSAFYFLRCFGVFLDQEFSI